MIASASQGPEILGVAHVVAVAWRFGVGEGPAGGL